MKKIPLFFYILLLSTIIQAQELGRLSLTYQNQTSRSIFKGYETLSSFHTFFLNFQQSFLQFGSINFSISGLIYEKKKEISFYTLRLQNIPIGNFKISGGFGYTSYKISSLLPFGSFNPSRFVSIKGGSLSLESEKMLFIFFGGRLYGITGIKELKTAIYGLKGIFRLIKDWTIGVGYIRGENLPNEKSKKADILTLDSSLRILNEFYLLSDFKYSFTSEDYSLKVGPYFKSKKLSLEFYYNYASPDFPQIERIRVSDREGYTFIGTIRPFPILSLFGSVDTYNENLERVLERPVSDFLTYSYGANFSPLIFPNISFRISISEREAEKEGIKTTDSYYNSFYLSLFKHFRRYYLNLRYNRGNFRNFLDATQDFLNEDYTLELRRMFLNGSLFYLNFYFSEKSSRLNIFKREDYNLQTGFTFKPRYNTMINSQFNYSYGKDKISGQKTRGIGGSLGIYYNFQPLKINFSLQYRFSRIQSIFPKTQKRDYHQVVFRITKSFTWGKRKTLSQVKSFSDIFKGTGTVEGFVFIDLNLNNIKDSKDVTLSDIEIMIDGRVITTTDENGYYRISPIIPGEHRISLLLRKIPAFYQPLFEEKKIKIKGRKTHHLNFILVPLGFVSGKVILDVNENGVKDEDEPGLQEIQVNLLKNGNLVFSILTNSRGEFKFDNLYPGKYIIEIDSKNIKEKYKKDKKSVIEINLKPGEELREITLLIKKYRKPKIKKVFDYFTGVISGQVILDANKNGKIDSGEKGLSNIQIEILPTKLKTKTDEEGYFVFENIVPGEYILRIDIKSLPENAYFTSPISKKIKILPGQKLENQNFLFFIKK